MASRKFLHGPLKAYQHLIETKARKPNAQQLEAIMALDKLAEIIEHYDPIPFLPKKSLINKDMLLSPDFKWISEEENTGFLGKLKAMDLFKAKTVPIVGPTGLYIYGGVGTGKSMLMDLFYNSVVSERKKRVHFHEFMQSIHRRIHDLKTSQGMKYDPIPSIAYQVAKESWLLCFDEFQVTDIADAMLLRRLLQEFFNNGVVLVTTSNRHPNELYKNGIQRESFLPAIALLQKRCRLFNLESGQDYRKQAQRHVKVYYLPLGSKSKDKMDKVFGALTNYEAPKPKVMETWGRELVVPISVGRVGRDCFKNLCGSNKSAADYLLIASQFDILFIDDIPTLNLDSRNEARRFITLIDTLYEQKVKLVASMRTSITKVFSGEHHGSVAPDVDERLLMDDLKLDTKALKTSIFTGIDEVFAFQRAVSRLSEMQGIAWIGQDMGDKIEKALAELQSQPSVTIESCG